MFSSQNKLVLDAISNNKSQIIQLSSRIERLENGSLPNSEIQEIKSNLESVNEKLTDLSSMNINDAAIKDNSEMKTIANRLSTMEFKQDSRDRFERRDEVIISNLLIVNSANYDFIALVVRMSLFFGIELNRSDIVYIRTLIKPNNECKCTDLLVKFRDFDTKLKIMKA
jgi:hypothetical protein